MEKKLRGMVNVTFPLNENNNEEIKYLNERIRDAVNRLPGLGGPAADRLEDAIRTWEDRLRELKGGIKKGQDLAEGYSKTLSILVLENFVINEGPKWDKFKKGAKKARRGAVTGLTIGSIALGGYGGSKMYNADRNYKTDMAISRSDYEGRKDGLERNKFDSHQMIYNHKDLTPETKDSLKERIDKIHNRHDAENRSTRKNRESKITKTRDNQSIQGMQALAGAAGLGVAPLLAGVHAAGAKSEKKKQKKKSLKESLNKVELGMFLNEESYRKEIGERNE